jgi:REP element-mobilizing transposase RayT
MGMGTVQAWGGWFHVVGTTYGAWLPGDPRGFRTRDHREHIEGDYKNPPKTSRQHLHAHARAAMKRAPFRFTPTTQQAACGYFIEALNHYKIDYTTLCVAPTHFHLLLRAPSPPAPAGGTVNGGALHDGTVNDEISHPPPPNIKHLTARLKSWVTHRMKQGHPDAVPPAGAGGLWGKGGKVVPINDESHFNAVRNYIRRHENEGAVVVESQ